MGRFMGIVLAAALLLPGCAGQQTDPQRLGPYVVVFATDDAALDAAGQQVIQQIAAAVRSERPRRVLVTGYGDVEGATGTPLGHRRAGTVIGALAAAGVNEGITHEQFALGIAGETTGIPVHKVVVVLTP
jgi:outer membrane protein OmpA-like peptidoglycan-associated protein